MALKLATIEHKLGITSNYFFQIGAETYNIFSLQIIEIMRKVKELGHLVGLHIDDTVIKCDEESIYSTIKWFSSAVTEISDVVSFHRPKEIFLNTNYTKFVSTYDALFFNNYLSDSRREPNFYEKFLSLLDNNVSKIQLLIHPEWWCEIDSIFDIKDEIVKRRGTDLLKYLKTNFNKVFGSLIEEESNDFLV